MKNNTQINRRSFLKKTGKSMLAATAVPAVALGKADRPAASERIVIGSVGVGHRGRRQILNFTAQKDAQLIAVCDVKSNLLKERQEMVNQIYQNNDCAAYGDFRELVGRKDIDVVVVASCDHWHVLNTLAAVRAGKDVFMEKPMGLSLEADQMLRKEVHRYDRRFLFGTQQRSNRDFRFACELVRNGLIGDLHTINVWSPGSAWGGSTQPVPVPEWLDYKMWQGPAPEKPYTPDRCSNDWWWFISDYAIGWIAGWGIHPLDIAMWGGQTDTAGNIEIEGMGVFPTVGLCDTAMHWNVHMKFANGLKLHFVDSAMPEEWAKRYKRVRTHGTAFEGSEGWVHVDRSGITAYPESILKKTWGPNDIRLYESNDHTRNLLDCVKSRKQTICPVDTAVKADILSHISDIAIRLNEKLTWDQEKEKFINNDEANQRLTRSMRSPWHL